MKKGLIALALLMVLCFAFGTVCAEEIMAAQAAESMTGELESISSSEGGLKETMTALLEEKAFEPLTVTGAVVNKTSAAVGDTITWTVSAAGGNYDYAYFFNIFCGDEVVQYGNWQLSPSISWTAAKPGNYYVAAYAVDSRWTEIAGPASEGGLCSVIESAPQIAPLSATLSVDKTEAAVGDTLTWTITPTGGNGDYAFFYNIFCGDEVVKYGDWQLSPSISWTATKPGNYFVAGYVVDSRWVEIAQAPQGGLIPVPAQVSSCELYPPDENERYTVGDYLYWTAKGHGGNGQYVYYFQIYCDNELIVDTGWMFDNHCGLDAPKAGNYSAVVLITDTTWQSVATVVQTCPTVVYSKQQNPLKIVNFSFHRKNSNKLFCPGDEGTFSVEAEGGAGGYRYSFAIYAFNNVTQDYDLLVEEIPYQEEDSYTWRCDVRGSYYAFCTVKDAEGNTATDRCNVDCADWAGVQSAYMFMRTELPVYVDYIRDGEKLAACEVTYWDFFHGPYDKEDDVVYNSLNLRGVKTFDKGDGDDYDVYIGYEIYRYDDDKLVQSGYAMNRPGLKTGREFDLWFDLGPLPAGHDYYIKLKDHIE